MSFVENCFVCIVFWGKQYNSGIASDYKTMPFNLSCIKKTICACSALFCLASPAVGKESLPNVELTGGLLFQIIASEFALQRHDPSTAFRTYLQIARNTKDPRLAKRAFEIADNSHAFEEAAEAAKLWEQLSPQSDEAQLANCLTLIRRGDLSEKQQSKAKEILKGTSPLEKRLKQFQAIVIQAELSGAQPQQILNFIRPLASLCKDQKEAALTLAKLYQRTGNADLAAQYAKTAWQQLPDNTVALLEYAEVLISSKPKEAIKILESFVQKHPKDYDAQLGLAKAYARTQNKNGVQKQIRILDPFAEKLPNLAFTLASVCDSVGMIDEYFAELALQAKDKILARNRAIIRENLQILDDWVKSEPRVSYVKPKAGTTAFVKIDTKLSSHEFCERLVKEKGVMFTPGSALHTEGYVRVGYANNRDVLKKGLALTSEFLKEVD